MDADTAPTVTDVEVIDPAPAGGMLAGLLGSIDMTAMLAGMGIEVPDADAATLDDVDGSIDELHAKVDWLAALVVAAILKAPARFRPEVVEPYPGAD